jgi:hypothetical protein
VGSGTVTDLYLAIGMDGAKRLCAKPLSLRTGLLPSFLGKILVGRAEQIR